MSELSRAVDLRLAEIYDIARSGQTERTGKTHRVRGDYAEEETRSRKFGGMSKLYPEIGQAGLYPKQAAEAIERGTGKRFRRLQATVRRALETYYPKERKRYPEKPVIPAHKGNRKCKICKHAHGKGAHRFHGEGSFHKTHLFAFNPKTVKIYGRVMRIYLGRGWYDLKAGAVMYGLPDKSILISWRGPKKPIESQISRIYGAVSRIDAQKTQAHRCDPECRDKFQHKYFHPFKPGAILYGLKDGNLWLRST